jgi:hypothetical protein
LPAAVAAAAGLVAVVLLPGLLLAVAGGFRAVELRPGPRPGLRRLAVA